ncbi:MAG: ABC transporter ATP-binding protein [Thermoplasmatota archaeon]
MKAIQTKGLRRAFGQLEVLKGIDLEVEQGGVYGFLGPNGVGKTTTLRILLGLIDADAGSVQVLGRDPRQHGEWVRSKSGVLLEHHGLYERMTAYDNLRFHAKLHRMDPGTAHKRINQVFEDMGLVDRKFELVDDWSRGMKRRLAVHRAFLHQPDLVFLDEPTSGFDPRAANELREHIRETAETGSTIFLTTHNMAEAEIMCDEVGILNQGHLISQGSIHDIRGGAQIHFRGTVPESALATMKRRKQVVRTELTTDGARVFLDGDLSSTPLIQTILRAGGTIEEVRREGTSLEQSFLEALQ